MEVPVWGDMMMCLSPLCIVSSTPLSSRPPVNTFIEGLLGARHSAGSEEQAVNQTYWIPFLKELYHNDWFWAKTLKVHIVGLITWEEMMSCWDVILWKGTLEIHTEEVWESDLRGFKDEKVWLSLFLLVPNYLSFWGVTFIMI